MPFGDLLNENNLKKCFNLLDFHELKFLTQTQIKKFF